MPYIIFVVISSQKKLNNENFKPKEQIEYEKSSYEFLPDLVNVHKFDEEIPYNGTFYSGYLNVNEEKKVLYKKLFNYHKIY